MKTPEERAADAMEEIWQQGWHPGGSFRGAPIGPIIAAEIRAAVAEAVRECARIAVGYLCHDRTTKKREHDGVVAGRVLEGMAVLDDIRARFPECFKPPETTVPAP